MKTELTYFGYDIDDDNLLDEDFLNAMVDNMRRGLKHGRKVNDWKERDENGVMDRQYAIARHYGKYQRTREPRHLAAIACNALICWWHRIREMED